MAVLILASLQRPHSLSERSWSPIAVPLAEMKLPLEANLIVGCAR